MKTKKPVTILVIDDDEDICMAVEQCLKETDIQPNVVTAQDAVDGLKLAKKHIPDVVVLDLNMPDTGGFDFVAELKQDPSLSKAKILILTAHASRSNIWQSIDEDTDDFLAKPFEVAELESRVKSLISKKQAGSGTI